MNAIQFLKEEHQKAKAAFGKLLAAAPAERGGLWKELVPELKTHEQIEETALYQRIAGDRPSDSKLQAWVSEGHEHQVHEVESLMKDTERLDPQGEQWLTTVRQIHSALENHIRTEEGEIFPSIGQMWDPAKLVQAGEEMKEMKTRTTGRR